MKKLFTKKPKKNLGKKKQRQDHKATNISCQQRFQWPMLVVGSTDGQHYQDNIIRNGQNNVFVPVGPLTGPDMPHGPSSPRGSPEGNS